jgi:putative serine protease PepD
VTTLGVTDGQRFCQRCGTALNAGRCPEHDFAIASPRAPEPSADRLSRPWSAGTTEPAPPPFATPAWSTPSAPPVSTAPLWQRATTAPGAPLWQRGTTGVSAPERQPEPTPRPAPHARSQAVPAWLGPVAIAVAAFLLIALIADHVYLQSAIEKNQHSLTALDQRLSAQLAATNALAAKVGGIAAQNADPAIVAAHVRASVYTIDTPEGLGSGWVVNSAGGTSGIITDYHVIASVWTARGAKTVQVVQNGTTLTGTIAKVDQGDDLALITVGATLTPLVTATANAMVGDEVLVVGSPLGLSGTVANGIVSSFRNGLIQFSAPISPGDSGGPVVNSAGQVIGVAESKLVGTGVEGLSFAIPITTVCTTVTTC